nr:hypothetical protein 25 [bacterium]
MDTSVLFSLQATGAIKLKKLREDENGDISYKMKMRKVNDNVTWFTDRPKREAGSGTLRDLIREWDDSFRTSNPNSALSYIDKDGNPDTIVFEQYKPKFNKRKGILTSKIKVHSDQVLKDISSKRRNPLSELALDARLDDNNSFDHKFKSGSLFIDNMWTKDTQAVITNNTNQTLIFTRLSQIEGEVDTESIVTESLQNIGGIMMCGAMLALPSERRRSRDNNLRGPLSRDDSFHSAEGSNSSVIADEVFESFPTEMNLDDVSNIANESVPGFELERGSEAQLANLDLEAENVASRLLKPTTTKYLKYGTKLGAVLCLCASIYGLAKNLGHALRGTYANGFNPMKQDDQYFIKLGPGESYDLHNADGGALGFTRENSKDVSFAINILSKGDEKAMIPYGVFSFDNPAIGYPKAYYKEMSGFDYSAVEEDRIIESGDKGDYKIVTNWNPILNDIKAKVEFEDVKTLEGSDEKVMSWGVTFNGNADDASLDTLALAASQIVPD